MSFPDRVNRKSAWVQDGLAVAWAGPGSRDENEKIRRLPRPLGMPHGCYGAKYPLISRRRCVWFVVKALTAPPVPAGTMAAFDVSAPSWAFSVETPGWLTPVGQRVR